MPDRPYTDEDLRAEAARQHAELTEDPDFVGVGEAMEDKFVPSVETTEDSSGRTWSDLLDPEGDDTDAYSDAMRKIHDLITGAANVSEWAVSLGADGLEADERQFEVNAGDKVIARVHFAFDPDMADDMRTALVTGLSDALAVHL